MSRRPLLLAIGLLVLIATGAGGNAVATADVNGPIGPATATYLERAIKQASRQGAECLIVKLDTPGGLLDSTKDIVQTFLASPIPIVVYVTPSGASATSAGCFIALAADFAAMSPATTIGAAHPVPMNVSGGGGESSGMDDTMKQKMANYAASYIESIATKRNRNVEWARSSVIESASITAEKALELKVVEFVAADFDDLIRQLEGRETNGKRLSVAGADVVNIGTSLTERVLQTLWRPEVMFILMLVTIYGIIGELSSPGAILPGVAGSIALVLVLYMSAILPVNIAGLALIGLALVLFVIDVFAPTHGILTGGGIAAFLAGSLLLFDRTEPAFTLSKAFIIPATVVTALFFVFVVGKGLSAQRLSSKVGTEAMFGKVVAALTPIDAAGGKIFVEGEYWNAVSDVPIEIGEAVEITGITGLTLKVVPKRVRS
jgi:membrane-bound serine protease (ClpP class)